MSYLMKHHFEKHGALFDVYCKSGAIAVETCARAIAEAFLAGGKLYLCGSGLSSFTADYTAALFMQHAERPALPAVALHSSICYMGENDPNEIYEKQIAALSSSSDVVWGMVSTPSCERILRALRAASVNKVVTISMTGADCMILKGVSDIFIPVESSDPLRVREIHTIIVHAVAALVSELIFNPSEQSL